MNKKEEGSVYVELCFILPVVFIICFGIFELVRGIRLINIATSLSRELANVSLRECMDEIEAVDKAACYAARWNTLEDYAQNIVPGTQLIISVFDYNGGWIQSFQYPEAGTEAPVRDDEIEAVRKASKSINLITKIANDDQRELEFIENLYIAECYIPYSTMAGFLYNFFSFDDGGGYFYDVSIL